MIVLTRLGSLVILKAKDGNTYVRRRKKLRRDNRRQKIRIPGGSVKYVPTTYLTSEEFDFIFEYLKIK